MSLETELIAEIKNQGAGFVHFVDISQLPIEQNKNYPRAILFGIPLSPQYLNKITVTPDYIELMKRNNQSHEDEFQLKEIEADRIADHIASYLLSKGYSAFSQSENNLASAGVYDYETHSTPLPHKTIARLAGMGWIGKHDLIVTVENGSAISMCTVLTNAPLKTVDANPVGSLCGNCTICKDNCPLKLIKGNKWDVGTSRDDMVDIYKCNCCLRCLAFCPWTIKYMKTNS